MNNTTVLLILLIVVVAGVIFFFANRDQTTVPVDSNETTQDEAAQNEEPHVPVSSDGIIGMTTAEAEAYAASRGVMFRVVEADGEPQPTTRDYREGRINATTENDIVISFYIEGEEQEDMSETGVHDGIIGLTQSEAEAYAKTNGVRFRVGIVDGEAFPVTMDFVPGRITAEIENGVVIAYTVE